MAPSKIRRAIGAIKDQTSISLARVGGNPVSNLQVAIVKATRHEENPPNQRYVTEIISLTSYSHVLVSACVSIIAARLNKTKNWVVALKLLMLVQRLLSQGGQAFEKEIFFATRKGTRFLNMCDFRNASSKSNAWHYSAFVRTYALYLDEQLEFRMQGHRGKRRGYTYHREEEKEGGGGDGAVNAMVVKTTPVSDMVRVHEIFYRISKQFDELDAFYGWSKTVGIMRFSEYPDVKRIPQTKLGMMDDFIQQKSAMLQNRTRAVSPKPKPTPSEEPQKALPQPEGFIEVTTITEERRDEAKETKDEDIKIQEEGDLLNLYEDAPVTEEHGDKYALALFFGDLATSAPASTTMPWDAYKDSSRDWEMALVQSVSHLTNQKPSLPKGFDTFTLDGMYQQGAAAQVVASSGLVGTGSASSVALGSAGRPTMLALPAPPAANGGANSFSSNTDPFAASLAIAPPPYVQMNELSKLTFDGQCLH